MIGSAVRLRMEGEEDNTCHAHGQREDTLPLTTRTVQNAKDDVMQRLARIETVQNGKHDVMQAGARIEKEGLGTVPQRRDFLSHSHAK
jgi:hypothetical protein